MVRDKKEASSIYLLDNTASSYRPPFTNINICLLFFPLVNEVLNLKFKEKVQVVNE